MDIEIEFHRGEICVWHSQSHAVLSGFVDDMRDFHTQCLLYTMATFSENTPPTVRQPRVVGEQVPRWSVFRSEALPYQRVSHYCDALGSPPIAHNLVERTNQYQSVSNGPSSWTVIWEMSVYLRYN